MRYGLKEELINKINQVFKKHTVIEAATLYGSRAKGTFKPGSDIDLTLIGSKLNLEILNAIRNDLDDLNLAYTIDVSIQSDIDNLALLSHIDRVGITFYHR
jgi:predicted nucleotidyltransferase